MDFCKGYLGFEGDLHKFLWSVVSVRCFKESYWFYTVWSVLSKLVRVSDQKRAQELFKSCSSAERALSVPS